MGADLTYNRPKLAIVNETDIAVTIEARETGGGALAALVGGTSGIAEVLYKGDLDESGGADVQKLGLFTITPTIVNGILKFTVLFTPYKGTPADEAYTAEPELQSYTFQHPLTMDQIQTDGGRARQA